MKIVHGTLFVLLLVALSIALYEWVPFLVKAIKRKILLRQNRTEKISITEHFLSDERPGRFFVALICERKICSIKTSNHGSEFPDNKQFKTFKNYATKDISVAIDNIGEGI